MQREELEKIAQAIREDILTMALHSGTKGAHIGGGMSCADILAVLYGSIMKYDVSDPEWDGRDRFIMSKAHSAIALYAALRYAGFLSEKDINNALQGRAYLYKHPRMDIRHGFEFSGGSLGQEQRSHLGMLGSQPNFCDTDGRCPAMSVYQYKNRKYQRTVFKRNH